MSESDGTFRSLGKGFVKDYRDLPAYRKSGQLSNEIFEVTNDPAEFTDMVQGAKPDTPFDVLVLRKGKEETVKGLSLPEMKTEPRLRRRPAGNIREILPYTPPPVKNDGV